MADPLTGKFFIAYMSPKKQEQYLDPPTRLIQFMGQVRSRVRDGAYLVKTLDGALYMLSGFVAFSNDQNVVRVEQMDDWSFFDSREAFDATYNAYARKVSTYGWSKKSGEAS